MTEHTECITQRTGSAVGRRTKGRGGAALRPVAAPTWTIDDPAAHGWLHPYIKLLDMASMSSSGMPGHQRLNINYEADGVERDMST